MRIRCIASLVFFAATLTFATTAQAQIIRDIAKNTLISAAIDTPGAIHYYRFAATAGEVVTIETLAQRLSPASPLDTAVSLLSQDLSRVLAVNDDIALNAQTDSLIWFTIPYTGNFVIRVEAFETFIRATPVGGAEYRYQVRWNTTSSTRAVDFAQIAEGDAINTSIILVNTSATAATGSVNLFTDDGSAFTTLLDQQFSSSFRFTVPPRGTLRWNTTATTALRVGWAEMITDTSGLTGSVVFIGRVAGRIVIEAGVCPAEPTDMFTTFVDSISPAATGFAIANPGTRATTLSMTLRDAQGNPFGSERTLMLSPAEHRSLFVHELFDGVPDIRNFRGTLTATSNAGAVSAVALKFDNADFSAITTVPLVAQAASSTTYFPQIANGGNYFRTSIAVINNAAAEASGELRLFKSDGSALQLPLADGRNLSTIPVRISARGSLLLESTGQGSLQAGWAVLTTNIPVEASAVFQTFNPSGVISEAGVTASRLTRRFTIFADTIGTARTAIAIANPSAAAANISVRLFNKQGTEVTTSPIHVTLGANQHVSRFIDEMLSSIAGINEFEGTVLFESDANVAAVSFRFDNFDASAFTTFCVSSVN